jgi:glycerol-3-phosphate acyltransferase PlsY
MKDLTLIIIYSYLLGSIPFGLILSKLFNLGDIRKIGSGNIGATNVLRTGNKKVAALTLFLDIAKGSLAVWITEKFKSEYAYISFILVYVGHIFPVWLKFKGGKGVATFLGGVLIINYQVFLFFIIVWAIVAKLFRISSLSALIAFFLTFILSVFIFDKNFIYLMFFFFIFSVFTHRENIKRLISGEESKIKP